MAVGLYLSRVATLSLGIYQLNLAGSIPWMSCSAVGWPRCRGHAHGVSNPVSWGLSFQLPAQPCPAPSAESQQDSGTRQLVLCQAPAARAWLFLIPTKSQAWNWPPPICTRPDPCSTQLQNGNLKFNQLDRQGSFKRSPYFPSCFSSNSLVTSQKRIANSKQHIHMKESQG